MIPKIFTGDRQVVLVEDPLYTVYDLSGKTPEELYAFFKSAGAVDAYCETCKKMSVFRVKVEYSYGGAKEEKVIPRWGHLTVEAKCSRRDTDYASSDCDGQLVVCFLREDEGLTKIGQYPSRATLDFGALDPVFNQELDKKYRDDLGRAVGLRAYGVGAGSFVYLRRIFEALIEEAHQEAKQEQGWDEDLFRNSRMSEKIKLLHSYLPSRLVGASHLYGVLSKGVHELTEEECLSHFDLLQRSIQMILKERHEEKEYDQIKKDLQKRAELLAQSSSS